MKGQIEFELNHLRRKLEAMDLAYTGIGGGAGAHPPTLRGGRHRRTLGEAGKAEPIL
ncbi:MAG: hypothetical protein ACP5K1_02920 [Candidatus Bathyarchaeia archaeon]